MRKNHSPGCPCCGGGVLCSPVRPEDMPDVLYWEQAYTGIEYPLYRRAGTDEWRRCDEVTLTDGGGTPIGALTYDDATGYCVFGGSAVAADDVTLSFDSPAERWVWRQRQTWCLAAAPTPGLVSRGAGSCSVAREAVPGDGLVLIEYPVFTGIGENAPACGDLYIAVRFGFDVTHYFPGTHIVRQAPVVGSCETRDLCVLVMSPSCPALGVDGVPIEGATVEVQDEALNTVGTCTTDADGRCCVNVPTDASYRVRPSLGGCNGEWQNAYVSTRCGPMVVASVLCCATLCLVVRNVTSDPDPTPIEDAVGSLAGHDDVTTGADGRACFILTSAQMLAAGISGGDCATRTFRVSITHPAYLTLCPEVSVSCGEDQSLLADAAIQSALLYPYDEDGDDSDDYSYAGAANDGPDLCPDEGCEVSGYADRGLVRRKPKLSLQAEIWDGTQWISILGGAGAANLEVELDDALLHGTPSGSPWEDGVRFFAPAPDLEYHVYGTSNWTPSQEITGDPSPCAGAFGDLELWARKGIPGSSGVILRHRGTGGATTTTPTDAPGCPATVEYAEIVLLANLDGWCIDEIPWAGIDTGLITVTGGGGGGRDLRYRIQVTQ